MDGKRKTDKQFIKIEAPGKRTRKAPPQGLGLDSTNDEKERKVPLVAKILKIRSLMIHQRKTGDRESPPDKAGFPGRPSPEIILEGVQEMSTRKMPMRKLRSVSSRLRELKESGEYGKAFDEVKRNILSMRQAYAGPLTLSEICTKGKPPGPYFLRKAQLPFPEVLCPRCGKPGIVIPLSKDHARVLSLKEVQKLLKIGNVNEWGIALPTEFEEFGNRWEIKYFYDPSKEAPENFDPFSLPPIRMRFLNPVGQHNPYKLFLEVDVRHPMNKVLVPSFKDAIDRHRILHGLAPGRAERYPDDEIFRVKKMLDQKKGDLQIFHELYPEHSSFHPKAYLQGSKEGRKILREMFKKFRKVQRLIRRAKEREK